MANKERMPMNESEAAMSRNANEHALKVPSRKADAYPRDLKTGHAFKHIQNALLKQSNYNVLSSYHRAHESKQALKYKTESSGLIFTDRVKT